MAKKNAEPEAAKAAPAKPKFDACGLQNKDYFIKGNMITVGEGRNKRDEAVKGTLLCQLPADHPGDHFAGFDEGGNPVVNGWWKRDEDKQPPGTKAPPPEIKLQ